MPTRRAFLMTMIGASAVGVVAIVTTTLSRRPRNAAPGEQQPNTPAAAAADAPAAAAGAAQPAPQQSQPVVLILRGEWGARAPAVSPGGRGENGPYSAANPNGWQIYDRPLEEVLETVIIHHSALPLSDGPIEIQRLHMDEKGFADVGYQYLIDENGKLYEGRALNVRGAHTYAHNYGSVGVCLIGNFEEIQPPAVQLNTLHALLKALRSNFPNITRLAGHKDFNTGVTLCPGENMYPLLPEIAELHGLRYSTT